MSEPETVMSPVTPDEMLAELIRLGYVTPVPDHPKLHMPSAYQTVPSVTTPSSAPPFAPHEIE